MTSIERHQGRYERRKAKRLKKKKEFLNSLPCYEEVFTFQNLYNSFNLCKRGVMWKSSLQTYESNKLINLADLHKRLLNETYRSKGFHHFTINERGKTRHIRSVNIDERVVQRCLCDNYLIPLLSKNLIYDNGATLKGKGTDFTVSRLKKHIRDYVKENGTDGYILIYDFSDYFNNIQHNKLYAILDDLIQDGKIKRLVHHFIDNFGENGLGLGSQISQITAVAFPNVLDHYFKDKCRTKGYGRYNDDGYIICKNLQEIKESKKALFNICEELGIKISEKKLHIQKLTTPFIFLKKKFYVKNGRVKVKIIRKTISRERRRLKKYQCKFLKGEMPYKDIENAYKSWKGSMRHYSNKYAVSNMNKLFNKLFIFNKEIFI
jgi:hypothetical protein